MKIEQITIYNFKSIGQECTINFNSKITTIIGKSNVGKSNILECIQKAFNDEPILPRQICTWNKTEKKCLDLQLSVETKDKKLLETLHLDSSIKKIVIKKFIGGKREIILLPEVQIKKWKEPSTKIIETLSNYRRRIRKGIRNFEYETKIENTDPLFIKIVELMDWVNNKKQLNPTKDEVSQLKVVKDFNSKLIAIRKLISNKSYNNLYSRGFKTTISRIINDISLFIPQIKFIEKEKLPYDRIDVLNNLPSIVFIRSDGKIKITEEIPLKAIATTNNDNFMKGLINISKLDIDIFNNDDEREWCDPIIEANKKISRYLARYWNQEKLKIELRLKTDTQNPKEPVKKLELDFVDGSGRRGSIMDQSDGTTWFLGFVVKHLVNVQQKSDIILILDEPGIMLHAGAQKDLIERFDNSFENMQIIYTTHSPYMIDKNYPMRIISVHKGDGTENKKGTYVNLKPYMTSNYRSWEPLRSSIGLPMGAGFFVSGQNLIVDGITDYIIIAGVIQAINKLEQQTLFDLNRVSIIFGGDHRNLVALALFCYHETKNVKVLLDSDCSETLTKKIIKGNVPKELIFTYSLHVDKNKIDIEDMFDTNFYHNCFLEAYKSIDSIDDKLLPISFQELKGKLTLDGKKNKWGHSKYYEEFFKLKPGELGRFDKVLVSKQLVLSFFKLDDKELKKQIEPLNKLLNIIWSSKPKW